MRKPSSSFSVLSFILGACFLFAGGVPGSMAEEEYKPLETQDGWFWTREETQQKLQDGDINQEQANRTLAADGGVCATQASETPVQTAVCESDFVFECVDLPEVGLSKCSNAVRGPECRSEEITAIKRVQEAAFINCMIELGWDRKREAKK